MQMDFLRVKIDDHTTLEIPACVLIARVADGADPICSCARRILPGALIDCVVRHSRRQTDAFYRDASHLCIDNRGSNSAAGYTAAFLAVLQSGFDLDFDSPPSGRDFFDHLSCHHECVSN